MLLTDWFKFNVQTFNNEQLYYQAERLASIALSCKPDVIIGIRSGGYVVAQAMMRCFPDTPLLPVTCRRASTQRKQKSLVKQLLRRLPDSVTSRLRIVEHIILTRLRPLEKSALIPDSSELAAIESCLRQYGDKPNILIVDDAVDSGATLAAVVDAVKAIAGPDASIKTAVITVTTAAPFIEPNFSLYRYVLCRFPWSLDFKN